MKKNGRNELRKEVKERYAHNVGNMRMREIILGGQDGLVNVLGIIFAVASATREAKLVLLSGLAGMFAESISMTAVNYTSSKAANEVYQAELKKEENHVEEVPELERQEIWDIFYNRGFRGDTLEKVVDKVTSNKKLWVEVMMKDELGLIPFSKDAVRDSITVGIAALVGSFVPLISFILLPVSAAVLWSVALSTLVLFIGGAIKGKITTGNWLISGIEIALIGIVAAAIGYAIGAVIGALI
jgi:predicted membrane protein (TIGR00267 family)